MHKYIDLGKIDLLVDFLWSMSTLNKITQKPHDSLIAPFKGQLNSE